MPKQQTSTTRRGYGRRGFSLIELVIVVVIIGIIAAIAVPKLSRGAAGASDSALAGDLKVLRTALDMYATEHGGTYPTLAQLPLNLTQYTDDAGNPSVSKDTTHVYGPYLRVVPPLPVGAAKSQTSFVAAQGGTSAGWVYTTTGTPPTTYTLTANTGSGENDAKGVAYSSY